MAIDKGPSTVQIYLRNGYIKTMAHGYIWTEKGIQFINDTLAELYHINPNDIDLDSGNQSSLSDNQGGVQSEQE